LNELYNQYRFPYTSRTQNITIQFFVHGITSNCHSLGSYEGISSLPVVTQNVCDQKDPASQQRKNPLREFCSPNINSDALLDLVVRYGDYDKKTSNNQPACLYYGLTSRKLRLENNQGIALGQ
jgi:hypothetical protein